MGPRSSSVGNEQASHPAPSSNSWGDQLDREGELQFFHIYIGITAHWLMEIQVGDKAFNFKKSKNGKLKIQSLCKHCIFAIFSDELVLFKDAC